MWHNILVNTWICQLLLANVWVVLCFFLNVDFTFSLGCKRLFFLPLGWVFIYLPVICIFPCVHILDTATDIEQSVNLHLTAKRVSFRSNCWYTWPISCNIIKSNWFLRYKICNQDNLMLSWITFYCNNFSCRFT